MKNKKFVGYGVLILIVVSLIRGFAGPGINASSGLFLKPVSEEIGVGIGQLSLYLSISSIATFFFLPIGGSMYQKYSVKTVAIIGTLLQTFSFAALGWMNSIWGWYLLSIPLAAGAVLLVNLLGPVLINRWFSGNQGFLMGMMMTITSLLGAVIQPILTRLISGQGWRYAYQSFGILAFIFITAVILLFLKDPQDRKTPGNGKGESKDTNVKEYKDNNLKQAEESGIQASSALKSLPFYLLLAYIVVLTGFATFSQHITTYGISIGFSMDKIGKALSYSMIGSAVGSVLIGLFSDRAGIIKTSIAVFMAAFLSVLLFQFTNSSYPVFAISSFLHGLATSSIGVVAPLLTSHFFGKKDYERLFSLVMMGSPLASIILMPAYGFIYDVTGGYKMVFLFLMAAIIVGSICLIAGNRLIKH